MTNQTQIKIHHILKNGKEVDDISGYVLKASEHKPLYEIIERIERESNESISTSN